MVTDFYYARPFQIITDDLPLNPIIPFSCRYTDIHSYRSAAPRTSTSCRCWHRSFVIRSLLVRKLPTTYTAVHSGEHREKETACFLRGELNVTNYSSAIAPTTVPELVQSLHHQHHHHHHRRRHHHRLPVYFAHRRPAGSDRAQAGRPGTVRAVPVQRLSRRGDRYRGRAPGTFRLSHPRRPSGRTDACLTYQ